MICVIATIKTKTGQRQALLACIQDNLSNVHAEVGCVEYQPMVDTESSLGAQELDEDAVVMVEKWETMSDLNAHSVAPHMLEYREKVKDIVESVSLKVLTTA
ncbi:TPA: antibiotic biosynthesis monooxygenase [Candidatus Poribacteria bacterium]|nr:antibiotic biosynthesis monooxygenase [Candidatus Poribacteria bacterium]